MTRAAQRAIAQGDVVTTAHAWVDAAFIAIEQGDRAAIELLVQKAELLARSPQLSALDRSAILVRINPTRLAGL